MAVVTRDFDVCVITSKPGDDVKHANIGIGIVQKDYIEIRLKYPVVTETMVLFKKSSSANDFLSTIDTGRKPKLNVTMQCHSDAGAKEAVEKVGVGFDNKKAVNIYLDFAVVSSKFFLTLRT